MGLSIDFHHRAQRTATQAIDRFQAELHFQVRLAGFDYGQVLHLVEHSLGPAHMTGRTHADVNLMTSLGNQAERFIKGRDMLDPAQRHLELFTDPRKDFLGKPVVHALDLQQDLNESAGLALMLVNDFIDCRCIHYLLFHTEPAASI